MKTIGFVELEFYKARGEMRLETIRWVIQVERAMP